MHPNLSELLKTIGELQPFPAVATRVMGLISDERTGAQELARVVSTDQAMTAKLLKLCNSAEAGYAHRVGTVREAVVVLGFKQVRQIAFVTSVISNFRLKRGTQEWFDIDRFWLHNIEVAVAAENVARHSHAWAPDEAFTTGVLHDIGRLVLVQAFPQECHDAWLLETTRGMSQRESEIRMIGYAHDTVGGALAREWKFPPEIATAIREHHSNELTLQDGLEGIIALCDHLALHNDESLNPIPSDLLAINDLCGGWSQVAARSRALIRSIEHGTMAA